jgi:hypothetical protein
LSQYPSGLTHYWPILFSTATDCVGTKHLGAPSSLFAYSNDRNLLTNDAINFNNGYVSFPPDATGYLNSAFTITLWVKAAACTTGKWCNLVDFGASAGVSNIFLASAGTNTGFISFYMYSSSGSLKAFLDLSANALSTTNWQFLAVSYDGYTITVYIDGLSVATKSNSVYWIPESVSRTGYLGQSFYSSSVNSNVANTVGTSLSQVDQIAIYNRDLTDAQILLIKSISYTPTGAN